MRAGRSITYPLRTLAVLGFLFSGFALLGARAFYLQVIDSGYLQEQGNARHLRVIQDNSHRRACC